jgi:uncharacterized protein (UPF0303 family)
VSTTPVTTGGFTTAQLEEEAASVLLGRFDLIDAVRLGQAITTAATAEQLPIVVEVDHGLRLAFRAALPGSRPDSDHWIAGKRRVVRRFERATLAVRVAFEERGITFAEATGLDEPEYAAHGGGVPILVHGVGIVGAVYVSGLPQVDDHALCISSLRSLA